VNPYEALGLAQGPGPFKQGDIERAYKAAARKAHPDREGVSAEKMTAINQARDILLNPDRKRRYDELGSTSNGPPSVEEQAAIILGNLFQSAVTQAHDYTSLSDMLGAIAQEISKGLDKALQGQINHPRAIKRAEKLLKGIDCDSRLKSVFEARIAKIERERAETNQQVEVGRYMLKLLQTVRFK
jgi:curved DNA-binding protein CbpA